MMLGWFGHPVQQITFAQAQKGKARYILICFGPESSNAIYESRRSVEEH